MRVVILAGGRGTRLAEHTHLIPKPMVSVGGRPILWHIMSRYAQFGLTDFVIALGYKGQVIKDYFLHYRTQTDDMEVDLASGRVTWHSTGVEDWRVTLVDTGEDTMTGGRLLRLKPYLSETFMLTYGDGVGDIDILSLGEFHARQGLQGTVTAVSPPPRFGSLRVSQGRVVDFSEKAHLSDDRINGGFLVLEPSVLDLIDGDSCVLESGPLVELTNQGQLGAYLHNGFWQPMDTLRERDELERLWDQGDAPWLRP
jgi:glucose-1-phosphate cytidylyltransferase